MFCIKPPTTPSIKLRALSGLYTIKKSFMKFFLYAVTFLLIGSAKGQELFVYTEPASNMAAKSIGIRAKNTLQKSRLSGKNVYGLNPEIMWGASKNIMVHADAFFSNKENKFVATGGSFYMKYRFFSIDEVHSHFRMAAFGRYSFSNNAITDYAIDLYGNSSGYEGGVVATKLIDKVALSASGSVFHALDNGNQKFLYNGSRRNGINYTLSAGKLMLPKEYTSYKQANVNLMLEFLGQTNLGDGASYIDVAPSVQFIFNSRVRIDLGYRYPIVTTLQRDIEQGALLRLEYNFFNAF